MKVTVKLYALLDKYLPAGASNNQAEIEVPPGTTPAAIVARLGLPAEYCHLVLINGLFVPPAERTTRALEHGDHLAIWPPVAGG